MGNKCYLASIEFGIESQRKKIVVQNRFNCFLFHNMGQSVVLAFIEICSRAKVLMICLILTFHLLTIIV